MDWFLYDIGLRHERVQRRIVLVSTFLVFSYSENNRNQYTFPLRGNVIHSLITFGIMEIANLRYSTY